MSESDLPLSLKEACQSGDLVRFSQQFKALPPSQQTESREPLSIIAIQNNQLSILKYCLSVGVLPTSHKVLFAASKNRSPDIYSALLSAGLPPSFSYGYAGTILMHAITSDNLPVVSLLLSAGATLKDAGRYSSCFSPLVGAAADASTNMASFLIDQGTSVKHSYALQLTAYVGRVDMLKFLLDHGADINENPTKMEGVYLDAFIKEFGTALHQTTDYHRTDAMRFLLDQGADATLKDYQGRSVVERSKSKAKDGKVWKELVDELKKRGIEV